MKKNVKPKTKWRAVPRHLRHDVQPGATDAKNVKVRVTMFLDLDVLEFFKRRAAEPGAAPYQTQINSELRRIAEESHLTEADPLSALRQATQLINTAAGQIQKRRPA